MRSRAATPGRIPNPECSQARPGVARPAPQARYGPVRKRDKNTSRPVSRVLYGVSRDGHSSGTDIAVRLKQPTRTALRKQSRAEALCHPYSVLLPVGFAMPCLSPAMRWALTPPFHPCPACFCARLRRKRQTGRFAFCGTFPRVAPAGRYPAPCLHGARTFLARRLSALVGRGRPASWSAPSIGESGAWQGATVYAACLARRVGLIRRTASSAMTMAR